MPTTHNVTVLSGGFEPDHVQVTVGDSVVWVNEDGDAHTATSLVSSPFSFNTGLIAANGGKSSPVVFTQASDHSGFPYHCTRTGHVMNGTVRVIAGRARFAAFMLPLAAEQPEPNFFRGPVVALTSEEMEIWPRSAWRAMRQVCAAGACYDLTQDFIYSLEILEGADRAKVEKEWQRIQAWWGRHLGWPAPLHNQQVLSDQPWESLEQLFRRLRRSWYVLAPSLISKYPRPFSIQSHDPFGKAITILPGKAPPYFSVAFERHANYAFGGANPIENEAIDVGKPITPKQRKVYQEMRQGVTASDYLLLALRQVRGLSSLFGSPDFDLEKFKLGYWRMTQNAEWDTAPRSAFHWVQFIEGYLGAAETGQTPHLVAPGGNWELQPAPKQPATITVTRRAEVWQFRRTEGTTQLGAGLFVGDHLMASWTKPKLGGGAGVILFGLGADPDTGEPTGLISAAWVFSAFSGKGALNATRTAGTGMGFAGTYQGSLVRADGIMLDTGSFELTKTGNTGGIEQFKFSWKTKELELVGVGITAKEILGASDGGQWLVVGFTRAAPSGGDPVEVTVADYVYDLDKLQGKVASSAGGNVKDETLARKLEPLDY